MLKQQILWSVALFSICGEYVQDQIGFLSELINPFVVAYSEFSGIHKSNVFCRD